MATPEVTALTLHRASRLLEVTFADDSCFRLPAEFLRVHSPSAEVQGHGPGQRVLLGGRRDVNISAIEPIGNYGVLLRFDDGHATGIFSWDTLYDYGQRQQAMWQQYLQDLADAGMTREGLSPARSRTAP